LFLGPQSIENEEGTALRRALSLPVVVISLRAIVAAGTLRDDRFLITVWWRG
jgi:hypothetical protein